MDDAILHELLDRWEQSLRDGTELALDELCAEHPELRDEVARQIEQLRKVQWMDESAPRTGGTEGQSSADRPGGQQPGQVIEGRYRLDAKVGEGAFGVVWRAFDEKLRRVVALKIAKHRISDRGRNTADLLVEARKLARLNRPGIVPVYDVIEHDGSYVIVSEFIEGVALSEYCAGSALDPHEAVRIVSAIARRLDHAHRHSIIHLDIKPSNILLNGRKEVFITDFGIAASLDPPNRSHRGRPCGTTGYIAPEQFEPTPPAPDARSDVYALGVVLYQLLTGQLPVRQEDPYSPGRYKFRPPSELVEVPHDVEQICINCLMPRDRRYKSAATVAAELQQFMSQRRHRADDQEIRNVLVGGFAFVVLLMLVGLFVLLTGEPTRPSVARSLPGPTIPWWWLVGLALWVVSLAAAYEAGRRATGGNIKKELRPSPPIPVSEALQFDVPNLCRRPEETVSLRLDRQVATSPHVQPVRSSDRPASASPERKPPENPKGSTMGLIVAIVIAVVVGTILMLNAAPEARDHIRKSTWNYWFHGREGM